jgi:hypothetical protein
MYLIYDTDGKITSIDTSKPGECFSFIEVSEVPSNVQLDYIVTDSVLTKRDSQLQPEYHYAIRRMNEYVIHEQLARLSDDINAGLFGEAAKTGSFMTMINGIKNKYPKR